MRVCELVAFPPGRSGWAMSICEPGGPFRLMRLGMDRFKVLLGNVNSETTYVCDSS